MQSYIYSGFIKVYVCLIDFRKTSVQQTQLYDVFNIHSLKNYEIAGNFCEALLSINKI